MSSVPIRFDHRSCADFRLETKHYDNPNYYRQAVVRQALTYVHANEPIPSAGWMEIAWALDLWPHFVEAYNDDLMPTDDPRALALLHQAVRERSAQFRRHEQHLLFELASAGYPDPASSPVIAYYTERARLCDYLVPPFPQGSWELVPPPNPDVAGWPRTVKHRVYQRAVVLLPCRIDVLTTHVVPLLRDLFGAEALAYPRVGVLIAECISKDQGVLAIAHPDEYWAWVAELDALTPEGRVGYRWDLLEAK